MNRRHFLKTSAAVTTLCALGATRPSTERAATTQTEKVPDNLTWHNVRDWGAGGIQGRAFNDTESFFDRLPARAKGIVRDEVWTRSRHTAGMCINFDSDAAEIYIRYEVVNESLAMPHMPATGVSGLDLYAHVDKSWHYLTTHSPKSQSDSFRFAWDLTPIPAGESRRYRIHLPLYNGVKSFEIGVPKSATCTPTPTTESKPILFYGTSITQGGCASRPGMAFTNILARRLDRPILNFGFSGNGRMEVEVVRFLTEIDPAIFVFDCVANCTAEQLTERTAPCVKLVRDAHPKIPILLLAARAGDLTLLDDVRPMHEQKKAAFKAVYEALRPSDPNLHYRPGEDLTGSDGEATVDGSHPTDLGMMRYADALEPTLHQLLPS
jgi:lysophospholipase L1-like esterase